MEGWIKLHRKLSDNPIWFCEKFTRGQAWVDLILLANHQDSYFYKRGVRIDVKRGQLGRSEVELSDRWKWSRSKVRKFLKDLEKEQQIIQHKTNVTQLLTVVNYSEYQQKEQQTEQQKDTKRTPKEHQKDTYKNEKNDKNDNITFYIFWDLYNYKVGKDKAELKWNKLSNTDKQKIIDYLPSYLESTPDKKYRKHPTTFLNNKSWGDEVIKNKSVFEEYENILLNSTNDGYKTLIEEKKNILYSFDSIITLDEYNRLNLNGKASKSFFISFQSYGKTKKDFLNNLYGYVRKYK